MYFQYRRKNKYGAKSTEYNGIKYHSKKEADYAQELDLRVKAKDIKGWERQRRLELKINDCKVCDYYMDFVIKHNDGTEEFVEVKGFETPLWRLKWKITEAIYGKDPNIKLTVVK